MLPRFWDCTCFKLKKVGRQQFLVVLLDIVWKEAR